ncbi:hypothetical protein [Absidia glauca]|uniref:MARVEL domain-containing protein n=1 Tax=Absidia glauca TaxID=4829 RepID=A0A168KY81_ABSGL|nr:hypothetical protein [Absidia glauca]
MGIRVFWLTLLRILLVIISAGTLACHIGNKEWWPKNYAYILYFVGPGVSILSSLGLVLLTITVHSVHGDRVLGPLNLALMIATVVIGTLKSGPVPWQPPSNAPSLPDTIGFQSSCSTFRTDLPLYQRCWLSNGMWLGSIVTGALWLLLVLYVFIQRSSDIYHDDDAYEVYDFKNGSNDGAMGMAVTSPSSIKSPPPPPHAQPTTFDPHSTYYDPGYSQHQQYDAYGQQHLQQQPYDVYGQQHYDGGNHQYYVPALAGPPSTTTPTDVSSHQYYPHDDTTHIIGHHPPSPPSTTKSNQVPHAYD